ncbi:MAG: flagellar filament capping protein FliD [Sarcina sp.]
MRIGGLASGLDTDTMVKQLMMPYQMKADRVKQDKMLLEYKQNLYRDVAKDMQNIYTKYFDIGSSANKSTNLIMSSNYDTVNFKSSDSSVLTARGLAGAKTGNYDVVVKQKAEASSITIGKDMISGESLDLKFGEQKISVSLKEGDSSIAGDGKAIVANINKAIEKHNSENKDDSSKQISVKVSYSELGENIRIEGKLTGEENNLKMGVIEKAADGTEVVKVEGKNSTNAIVEITDTYGNTAEKSFANNIFVIDNVEYSIHGVSKDTNGTKESVKLSGVTDTSKIMDNVRAFVEDYNKLIDKMNGFMGEKQDKNFRPLTEEQKKEMSETEIKLWEEKSKKGLLRNDDILYSTVNELLGHVSSMGNGKSLKDIGISTNPDYRTQKGKLVLDEEKLAKAFSENGEETRKMLTGTFNKIKDTFNDVAISSGSKIAKRAGTEGGVTAFNNEISKKMELKQKEYEKLYKSLAKRESQYYAEFSRLEVAMNKANAQMSQFISMGAM